MGVEQHLMEPHNIYGDDPVAAYDQLAHRYDADYAEDGYTAAERLAAYVGTWARLGACVALDMACGTGLAGQALARRGVGPIDGIDLSLGMLEMAETKGVYRRLEVRDASDITGFDQVYDLVVCCEALTLNHAPPMAIGEGLRLLKPDGFLAYTLDPSEEHEEYHQYQQWLVDSGGMELVACSHPFRPQPKNAREITSKVWMFRAL